jgi:hypothetical protein
MQNDQSIVSLVTTARDRNKTNAFRFDPLLTLKDDFTVEALNDATVFARAYTRPRTRDGVLFWLVRANDSDQQEKATDMFRAWVNLEGILVK